MVREGVFAQVAARSAVDLVIELAIVMDETEPLASGETQFCADA
jgi:hypothetical protein